MPSLRNKMLQHLERELGAGPFDGGCMAVAKAMQHALPGEIKVLACAKTGRAEHAVLDSAGLYWDFDGPQSEEAILSAWRSHYPGRDFIIREKREGDLPEAPTPFTLVSLMARDILDTGDITQTGTIGLSHQGTSPILRTCRERTSRCASSTRCLRTKTPLRRGSSTPVGRMARRAITAAR